MATSGFPTAGVRASVRRVGAPGGPPASGGRAGFALLLGALLMPLAMLGVGATFAWRTAWHEATTELARTAGAEADQALRMISSHGIAFGRVNDLLRGLSDEAIRRREAELHDALRRLVAELPQVQASSVTDRNGELLLSTTAFPVPRGIRSADHDAFQALAPSGTPVPRLGQVHLSWMDGRPFLAVSHRRTETGNGLPPEAFDGLVNLITDPATLSAGLAPLTGDGRDALALLLADGEWLALTDDTDRLPPQGRVRALAAEAVHAASFSDIGPGGMRELVAMHRLDSLPVYAAAFRPHAAVIAHWAEMMLPQLVTGLPAALLLLALTLRVRRGEEQLRDANAGLERRVSERTAALAELSEALDLTPVMILVPDGTIRHWSAGCERLYGFTRAEATGRRAAELLRTEWPPGGRGAAMHQLTCTGEWHGELVEQHKDGTRLVAATHWILRRDPVTGQPGSVVSTRADLTALRRAEDALRSAEARLRRAQEASGVIPFEVTSEGTAIATDALLALYGLPQGATLDFAAWLARIHPEDREAIIADHARLAREGGVFAREFRILLPDGRLRWLLSRGEAEADPAGSPMPLRIMGVSLDITARKLSESALAESEARLRLAQQAAGFGIFDYDFRTGRTTWDERLRALWGVREGQQITHRTFLEGLHPEDRALRRTAMRRAVQPGSEGRYQMEYRVISRADGRERWVAVNGNLTSENGRPARLIGVVRDITERKHAEQRNELLRREVDHRAKNALAVVQAALRLSRAHSVGELVRIVEGRIAALARAQTMLARQRWEGAALQPLLEGELAPFLATTEARDGPRAVLAGPPITIPAHAVQPLSMALHELATNAVKYGALSRPGGTLTVTWSAEPSEAVLRIAWQEAGGPGLAGPPDQPGFGSRVIDQTIRSQLSGTVTRNWQPGGLRCDIRIPLGPGSGRMDTAVATEATDRAGAAGSAQPPTRPQAGPRGVGQEQASPMRAGAASGQVQAPARQDSPVSAGGGT